MWCSLCVYLFLTLAYFIKQIQAHVRVKDHGNCVVNFINPTTKLKYTFNTVKSESMEELVLEEIIRDADARNKTIEEIEDVNEKIHTKLKGLSESAERIKTIKKDILQKCEDTLFWVTNNFFLPPLDYNKEKKELNEFIASKVEELMTMTWPNSPKSSGSCPCPCGSTCNNESTNSTWTKMGEMIGVDSGSEIAVVANANAIACSDSCVIWINNSSSHSNKKKKKTSQCLA